jgi:hypothetical protein
MTFSLRSILFVIAVVGVWLGAILSQSTLAVELAAAATNLFLLLSVALAIWHPQADQRKFWTGFCLLGLGSFVLGHYFSAYETTKIQIANIVASATPQPAYSGPPVSGTVPPNYYAPPAYAGGYITYNPAYVSSGGAGFSGYVPNIQQQQIIFFSVTPIISLLAACAGGWLTLWIARPKKTEQTT